VNLVQKISSVIFCLASTSVWAQEATSAAVPQPDPSKQMLLQLPIFVALFALFYFGMIRPQKQQAKKHQDFLSSLNRGDQVVLASGIIGTIRGLTDKVVTLEIAPETEIKVLRGQIQTHLKDGISAST
jgi:preprotein translocase subunit YajC